LVVLKNGGIIRRRHTNEVKRNETETADDWHTGAAVVCHGADGCDGSTGEGAID